MKIKTRDWCILILLAALSFCLWSRFEYPRFAFVQLPFNKHQAINASLNFLQNKGVNTKGYRQVIVFDSDEHFNRFFQHSAGLPAEEEFIRRYDFDLFRWIVRFYKEGQKEEYLVYLSPRTGKVIHFSHSIEEVEPRPDPGKENARQRAQEFLKESLGADWQGYVFHEEKVKRFENRQDYVFSWEKEEVHLPWKGKGVAKLLAVATVSGEEIREFTRNKFEIPEEFSRYVQKQFILGAYLYNIFYIILFTLLAFSISIVLKSRQTIVGRLVKNWYYAVAAVLMLLNTADLFNNLQGVLISYPTSARLGAYIGLAFTKWLFNSAFLVLGFIMPGIAGEGLRSEVLPQNQHSSFSTYIRSSFFNRSLAASILLGYLICVIMLGMQAVIFYNGQKYLGVWKEWYLLTAFSSAYIPLFSAFVIAVNATMNEEVIFRLFGISLAKKHLRNALAAVLVTSVAWGLGHTMYAIFPVWFRIIEISIIGILYGFIFLRFGIIPLICAHYLFDAFWCSAPYLLGKSSAGLFCSAVGLLSLPLVIAAVAYWLNRSQKERDLRYTLNKIQEFNLEVLNSFILAKKSQGLSRQEIARELIDHNWDHLLVEMAVSGIFDK